jgi:hypothetical protein
MTVEMGRRTRAAVLGAIRSTGVTGVALVGYANEFLHYFTTPEEYEMQHYEGGSTLYGKYSSNLIMDDLATLAGDLARNGPAPAPVNDDPRNGLVPSYTPYDAGADHGQVDWHPASTQRLQRTSFAWRGAARGLDRPLDHAFVTIQRRIGKRWRPVTDDLGLELLWRVDDNGRYTAQWQVPLPAAEGAYRFVVTANRYRLSSAPFHVARSTALTVHPAGKDQVTLDYPAIDPMADLTSRPAHADGGQVSGVANGRRFTVRRRRGQVFMLPAGAQVPAGGAADRFGNRN